jgi:molybdopterin molybdotransferase
VIELAEARRHVLAQCRPLHPRAIPLGDALGCVTSIDLISSEPVPPFANTAVDGFAVRAADVADPPVTLPIIGTIPAGSPPEPSVGPGQAVRILTGAPVPPGADAVVMVEDTSTKDDRVTISAVAKVGDHIRPAGDDISVGQQVIDARTELTPAHLGVLASIGVRNVPVFPRARVGVLSTGDELIDGSQKLEPGQIRESNRHILLALAAQAGGDPVDLGVVGDNEDAIAAALTEGVAHCDAILTSGGVSVGDFDFVKTVLDRLSGGSMRWMQIAIKPAKPFAFGVIDGTPVFGLPGNPVSSLVSFECLARPALRQMMGHPRIDRAEVGALADEPIHRRPDGRLHLVRCTADWVDGAFHVRPAGGQASHHLLAAAGANALALVPDGDGVEAGQLVRVILVGWGR